MVGHRPLEARIGVQVPVPQVFSKKKADIASAMGFCDSKIGTGLERHFTAEQSEEKRATLPT